MARKKKEKERRGKRWREGGDDCGGRKEESRVVEREGGRLREVG